MKNKQYFLGFETAQLKQWFLYWLVLGTGFIILTFLILGTWIGVDIKARCLTAQGKYEGDCVEALTQTLDDDTNSLRERNYAIWALGQLGDERALPIVEKYYTGEIPDREPYDETLSQYEMEKTIKLLKGDTNITSWLWRNGI